MAKRSSHRANDFRTTRFLMEKRNNMSRLLGVNTLVFNEELSEGTVQQLTYIKTIKELGFSFVEIRREFLRNLTEELLETKTEAERFQMPLYYSVPSVLFESREINPALTTYFEEARMMGAIQVKVTLGDYHDLQENHVESLAHLFKQYPDIQLSIENDQSIEGGSAKALSDFIFVAHSHQLPIQLTFDTGNVLYIQELAEEAAVVLKDYVNYIHIKNVKQTPDHQFELALIGTGDIDIQDVLAVFPENIPAAIEYPCGNKETAIDVLKAEKAQLI